MSENENNEGHTGTTPDVLWINGREREVYGELLLLDSQGMGLILLIASNVGREEPAFVAVATVLRPDLKLRFMEEGGEPLDGNRYAAETFATMPPEVASGIFRPDLLESLAGMTDCPECQAEREAQEAGEEEDRTS